jgi:phage-related tail protein
MKTKLHLKLLLVLAVFLTTGLMSAQTLYNVKLGTDNKKITEVQIEFNGNTITQANGFGSTGAPASRQTSLPVLMNYTKINDGGFMPI